MSDIDAAVQAAVAQARSRMAAQGPSAWTQRNNAMIQAATASRATGVSSRAWASSRSGPSLYQQAWSDLDGTIRRQGRQGKHLVGLEAEVKLRPDFIAFMKRLDRAPAYAKKMWKDRLRQTARTEILPRLKPNIPQSDKRKRHLRSAARITNVFPDKVVIGVGDRVGDRRTALWYAHIVHAKWSPFFPKTFKQAWKPFNKQLLEQMDDLMAYLAGRRIMV